MERGREGGREGRNAEEERVREGRNGEDEREGGEEDRAREIGLERVRKSAVAEVTTNYPKVFVQLPLQLSSKFTQTAKYLRTFSRQSPQARS